MTRRQRNTSLPSFDELVSVACALSDNELYYPPGNSQSNPIISQNSLARYSQNFKHLSPAGIKTEPQTEPNYILDSNTSPTESAGFSSDELSQPKKEIEKLEGISSLLGAIEISLNSVRSIRPCMDLIRQQVVESLEKTSTTPENEKGSIHLQYRYPQNSKAEELLVSISTSMARELMHTVQVSSITKLIDQLESLKKELSHILDSSKKSVVKLPVPPNHNIGNITNINKGLSDYSLTTPRSTVITTTNIERPPVSTVPPPPDSADTTSAESNTTSAPNSSNITPKSAKNTIVSKNDKREIFSKKTISSSSSEIEVNESQACKHCGSDDTPEWRRGPYGARSLCNACGLFFTKLTKKFGETNAGKVMFTRKKSGEFTDRRVPNVSKEDLTDKYGLEF